MNQSKDVAEIPQFFFPGGPRIPDMVQRDMQNKLDHCFASQPEGLTIPAVKDLIKEVTCLTFQGQLGFKFPSKLHRLNRLEKALTEALMQVFQLPTALAYPLFYKLAQPGASTVTLHAVRSWIVQQSVMQVRIRLVYFLLCCIAWVVKTNTCFALVIIL